MSGDNTIYTVSNHIPNQSDWIGQSFILDLGDTTYVPKGTVVTVAKDFSSVTFTYPNGTNTISTNPPVLAASGLLSVHGRTPFDTVTANNVPVAANTPIFMVFTMIIVNDLNVDEVDRHFTILTLVDDPENAGVMGGSDGGGGPLPQI